MKIGSLILKNNIFSAPMAGVSDVSYRLILKEMGAGLVFTEMISSKALFYGDKKTEAIMKIDDNEHPVAVQVFGSEPETVAYGAKCAEKKGADIIDINMGCPVPKVAEHGDGSALMKNPKLAGEIVKAVKKAVTVPLTVKIRKGWDEKSVNAVSFAEMLEDSGADAVTVHGRTREQMYGGRADLEIIARVKEALTIPVIGNGDIFSAEDAKKMVDLTGCDAVMPARGLEGNPWLIKQILELFNVGKVLTTPTKTDKKEMAVRHAAALCEIYGEESGIRKSRCHLLWYTKGFKNAASLRGRLARAVTLNEVKALLAEGDSK